MNKLLLLFIFILAPLNIIDLFAQVDDDFDDFGGIKYKKVDNYQQDTSKTLKALFLDGGFSNDGLSFALGVRYWNLFFDIGSAAIGSQSTPYSHQAPYGMNFGLYEKLPAGYSRSYIPGNTVFMDVGYYLAHLETLTFYIMLGFFAQEEVITVVEDDSRLQYYVGRSNSSGWILGGGMEYTLSQWVRLSLGYHEKRGVFARISYTWR